ncbi:hypothetical protein [Phenylobacterium sp.]|uniref:hypothetical protein n=1 Tax=Phenylobacterium sp. TaxID=1871053 RepID=UPI002FDE774D
MKPDIPAVLAELAGLVARNAVPDVDPAERAGALSLSAALLGMAAEAWDGAAQRLVEENRALRALLAEAGERAGRNAWLAGTGDDDLRISALSAANARLRAALIELHVAVEGEDSPEARRLEDRVWEELRLSTERRMMIAALA